MSRRSIPEALNGHVLQVFEEARRILFAPCPELLPHDATTVRLHVSYRVVQHSGLSRSDQKLVTRRLNRAIRGSHVCYCDLCRAPHPGEPPRSNRLAESRTSCTPRPSAAAVLHSRTHEGATSTAGEGCG